MSHYSVGLVVGRFQPFHKGHLYMLKEALKIADKLVIALGSSNISNEDNPLSFEKRKEMFQEILVHEGLEDVVVKIVPSPDFASDDEWLQALEKNAGAFDVAISNNDWTIDVMSQAGYATERVPFFEREKYQATFIRQLKRAGEKWEDRVPEYLTHFISKSVQ
jgi:nicotinamide-nucleotide adenylyltransferase